MSPQIAHPPADEMVENAVAECAEAHFAGDRRRTRLALLRGRCEHCTCITRALIRQVGEYLGQVAKSVRAVYEYRPIENPEEKDAGTAGKHAGIHLVVWVDHKSPA